MKGSLNQLLEESLWDAGQRVYVAQLSAMSIMALHELGIVHRDVKSHNFLFDGGVELLPSFFGCRCLFVLEGGRKGNPSMGCGEGTTPSDKRGRDRRGM